MTTEQISALREQLKQKVHDYKHASHPRFMNLLGSRIPEDWALDVIIEEVIAPLQAEVDELKKQLNDDDGK